MKTLRQYRRSLDLSQSEFGQRVGVTASMISQVERGERKPPVDLIDRICTEFKVVFIFKGGQFWVKPEKTTEAAIKAEAAEAKGKSPLFFYGSYQLSDGGWQSLLASDDKQELIELITFHAQGNPWFVV